MRSKDVLAQRRERFWELVAEGSTSAAAQFEAIMNMPAALVA